MNPTQTTCEVQAAGGFIPLAVPEIRGNEWRYVKECLDTSWVSSVGPYVDRFEQMVARQVEASTPSPQSTGRQRCILRSWSPECAPKTRFSSLP